MKKLSLREIQLEELTILKEFDAFCGTHKLHYSLAGGTLLGAVRHKGFIPWDDDIDVCMPRPDYEKFLSLASNFGANNSSLKVEGCLTCPLHCAPFVKIVNTKISIYANHFRKKSFLWIDVFPVDGIPSHKSNWIFIKMEFFRRLLLVYAFKPSSTKSIYKRCIKAFFIFIFPQFKLYLCKLMTMLAKKYEFGKYENVAVITWGLHGTNEIIPYKTFNKTVKMTFEDMVFPCMGCWEEYLTGLYGDYMQLPPENQRSSHLMDTVVEKKDS